MNIRPEKSHDHAAIFAVHAECFPTPAEARLVDLLRSAGRLSISLVVEDESRIVGHVAFSPVTAATGDVGLGLAPLAVLGSHRRRGIAAELIKQGLVACRAAGFRWTVVLGEPSYYGQFGFQPAARFGLSDEYGGGHYFQALEFVMDAIPSAGGLVQYSPEFVVVA